MKRNDFLILVVALVVATTAGFLAGQWSKQAPEQTVSKYETVTEFWIASMERTTELTGCLYYLESARDWLKDGSPMAAVEILSRGRNCSLGSENEDNLYSYIVLTMKGYIYFNASFFVDAQDQLETALEYESEFEPDRPRYSTPHCLLAEIYRQEGDDSAAEEQRKCEEYETEGGELFWIK